ncbi:single-stranded-DNA-specific exonuclease RecJ [Hydrogenobaculum acidophilum]
MISALGRKVYIKSQIKDVYDSEDFYDIIFNTLLSLRNIKPEDLESKLKNIPSFELLPNIESAVERLVKAIKNKERIILYGDYDVDGVTSTTIMYDFLKQIGANVTPVLPNRVSGYGLSKDLLDLFSKYSNLVLTLDNGTTATEEIKYAKEKYNMDFIILDHHRINEEHEDQDKKAIIVNPNLEKDNPLKGICTAGLSFYMVGALRRALDIDFDIKRYLDLVAIGTIADVMPINPLNRILISKGLELINKIKDMPFGTATEIGKAGMKALINYITRTENGKTKLITAKDIGFSIAPRINAAGRIKKPIIAMRLLAEKDYEKAKILATDLDKLNQDRRKISNSIFREAYELATMSNDDFIVLGKDTWHHGVLGIVAGRLSNKLKKPTGIFYINSTYAVGSVRSVEGLDVHKLLSNVSYMFDKWGGHAGAAGITIKKEYFEAFKRKINDLLKKESFEVDRILEVDMELPLRKVYSSNGVDKNMYRIVERLSPYGELNPEPVFMSQDITISSISNRGIGVKIKSIDKGKEIELNCFEEELFIKLKPGQCLKAIYNIDSYGINMIDAVFC